MEKIYVIRKEGHLEFLERPRQEEELWNTELLYTLDEKPGEDRLRPFKRLGETKGEFYKDSLLDFLPDLPLTLLTPISEKEVSGMLKDVMEYINLIGEEPVRIRKEEEDIKYECDVWNYLEDCYGRSLSRKIKEWMGLMETDKEFLKGVWLAGNQGKRSKAAISGNWSAVFNLLPKDIQEELLVFGEEEEAGSVGGVLEFRNPEMIGPEKPDIKELIYSEFKLGEVIIEGVEIKERLGKIYKEIGEDRNPKIKDLDEWFITVPCWQKGQRGIRIDLRKGG
jgi:hypothetical protein